MTFQDLWRRVWEKGLNWVESWELFNGSSAVYGIWDLGDDGRALKVFSLRKGEES